MSAQSAISWTDSTFNPWMGCTKVSPACDHCYAERDTKRFGRVQWGAGQPRVRTAASNWKNPGRWNDAPFAECAACGWRGPAAEMPAGHCNECGNDTLTSSRRRVFCASLADWLDNEVSIEWLVDLLDLIRLTPNLDWLLLSKRVGNFHKRLQEAANWVWANPGNGPLYQFINNWSDERPYPNVPPNVWIGSTVVNQTEADRDVPKLLAVPARVRFLSIEPMLGPIDLLPIFEHRADAHNDTGIHWIIAGGESGQLARPMHPEWVRLLRDQCAAAGVTFHFKQWGGWAPQAGMIGTPGQTLYDVGSTRHTVLRCGLSMARAGKAAAGRLLDGREHNGFPA